MMGKRMIRTGGLKRGDDDRRRGMELVSCGHNGGGSPVISVGRVLSFLCFVEAKDFLNNTRRDIMLTIRNGIMDI